MSRKTLQARIVHDYEEARTVFGVRKSIELVAHERGLSVERVREVLGFEPESRNVYDGYNVEFQGARPPRAGEDY